MEHFQRNDATNISLITNEQFIDAIFGGRVPEGYSPAICSKSGDPTKGGYHAVPATPDAIGRLSASTNNYVSNAAYSLGGEPREFVAKQDAACGVYALLIDDYGTKVAVDNFDGFKLSWLLETSPNNYQAGILLSEPISVDDAARLVRGLINRGLSDPGATGGTRWMRSPIGVNGKAQHADPVTGEPFVCRLIKWGPEARYTSQEIIERLGLTIEPKREYLPPDDGVAPTDKYARVALEDECNIVVNAPQGQRNAQLNRSAFSIGQLVGAGSLDRAVAEHALLIAACTSGLLSNEARPTIKSGLDDGLKHPRFMPERSRSSQRAAAAPDQPAGGANDDNAPLPLYPALPPSNPYPIEALGPLAAAARAIASKVQVPPAVAGQSVLAVAALATQAFADVALPYGQTRPLSLYCVTVLGSGDRKSTADNEASWAIHKHEANLHERYEREIANWQIASVAYAAERRKIEGDKGIDMSERRDALKSLGPEPVKPLAPFIVTGDLTLEGLTKAWSDAHPALGVFTAEGGTFTGGHGMSAENRLRTAAALSEAWDGKPIKRIRAQDGVTVLPGRRLSAHLLIQPDASHGFLGDTTLRDQGLLSRILVAAPESLAGGRLYREPAPSERNAIAEYGSRILSILETQPPRAEGRACGVKPRALPLSPGARAAWIDFHDHVEVQTGPQGDLATLRDVASKAAENAARIAGVLTLFENTLAADISVDAMVSAIHLMNWYLSEAERLHFASRLDPRLRSAATLLDWLSARGEGPVAFRDILQCGPRQLRTNKAAEDAINVLLEHRQIVQTSTRPRIYCRSQTEG